jgi:hypothetical protein
MSSLGIVNSLVMWAIVSTETHSSWRSLLSSESLSTTPHWPALPYRWSIQLLIAAILVSWEEDSIRQSPVLRYPCSILLAQAVSCISPYRARVEACRCAHYHAAAPTPILSDDVDFEYIRLVILRLRLWMSNAPKSRFKQGPLGEVKWPSHLFSTVEFEIMVWNQIDFKLTTTLVCVQIPSL